MSVVGEWRGSGGYVHSEPPSTRPRGLRSDALREVLSGGASVEVRDIGIVSVGAKFSSPLDLPDVSK